MGWAKIAMDGDLDLAAADELMERVGVAADAGSSVELDLRDVSFMDVAGLGAVLRSIETLRERRLRVALTAPLPKPVARIATIVGVLDDLPLTAH
jgi:anti-anti-sigma factor